MTEFQISENQKQILCEDDGLPMRETGSWAAEKLDYLYRYLNIFTKSMSGKNWRALRFIDLFSGPGKCHVRDSAQILLGSPLLALSLEKSFSELIFADMNSTDMETLKKRYSKILSSVQIPKNVKFYTGNSNILVNQIVKDIITYDELSMVGKWSSMNLAFLDPEGFELEWNTVASLGLVKKMDLIIYYPQMGISREMPNEINTSFPNKIDKFFGCDDWRKIYTKNQMTSKRSLHRDLLDLYEDNLKKLGYGEIKENEPVIKNSSNRAPLYRLIFASKHPLGNEFWEKVTRRDLYGQSRLC